MAQNFLNTIQKLSDEMGKAARANNREWQRQLLIVNNGRSLIELFSEWK
jgi:hypothetical protein